MQLSADLTEEALEAALAGRSVRSYVALVSTGSAALGWASSGAPDGAVVVADHQLSPRGHAGRPWTVPPGEGLGFSLVVRPSLPAEREGWLYTVVLSALAGVCGEEAAIEWPDEVRVAGETAAAVGIKARLGAGGVEFGVVDVLMPTAKAPRGPLIRKVVEAIEAERAAAPDAVIERYDGTCATIGRQVHLRFLAGTGPVVGGKAVATLDDGALLLETATGRRAPVRPQDVRGLEDQPGTAGFRAPRGD